MMVDETAVSSEFDLADVKAVSLVVWRVMKIIHTKINILQNEKSKQSKYTSKADKLDALLAVHWAVSSVVVLVPW